MKSRKGLSEKEEYATAIMFIGVVMMLIGAYLDFDAFVAGITPSREEFRLLATVGDAAASIPTENLGWLYITVVVTMVIVLSVLAVILEQRTERTEIRKG